uniref:type II toxin-antitoxin system PemK/MazF family toxin n=1 Tax=uncultured Sphingomonas sp. TaxID=158754 RepID=UPI0035CC40CE
MGLNFYPDAGMILVCHYDAIAPAPEMIKSRPVVVVGPRLRRRGRLAAVVPLSTTAPAEIEAYHCRITLAQPLPAPFDAPTMWGKCDMVSSVSLDRLDRFKEPRARHGGARQWRTGRLSPEQLAAVRVAVLRGLGWNLDKIGKIAI